MFDKLFEGQVALVTGSTSGVGKATARTLGQAGCAHVVINGRRVETGARVLAELTEAVPSTTFHFVSADMNRLDEIAALFAKTEELCGGLDVFVHSGYGGGGVPDLFDNMTPEMSEKVIMGVYLSLVRCCHYAVPLLKKRGRGAIVGVASDAAKVPTPGESVHGGALAGSMMFLRGLAREMGRHKIRANGVTPSLIGETENYDKVMAGGYAQKLFQKIEKRATLGLPVPQDLANLITFLASPLADKISGQVVSCNGGISGA
jgi:NAD(P)-dependent dehydrogenase (short-subunit alcohol dehydrogenase family)